MSGLIKPLLFLDPESCSFRRDMFEAISARASKKLDTPFVSDRVSVLESLGWGIEDGEASRLMRTWGTFFVFAHPWLAFLVLVVGTILLMSSPSCFVAQSGWSYAAEEAILRYGSLKQFVCTTQSATDSFSASRRPSKVTESFSANIDCE